MPIYNPTTREDLSEVIEALDCNVEARANPGWVLDYLPCHPKFDKTKEERENQPGNLKELIERTRKHRTRCLEKIGFSDVYSAAFQRHRASVSGDAFERREATAITRVLAGHWIHSVVDMGIKLHHTYGIPYLPGSSLKGIARHYTLRHLAGYSGENEKQYPIPEAYNGPEKGYSEGQCTYLPGPALAPDEVARLKPEEAYLQYTAFDVLFGRQDFRGIVTFHDAWMIPEKDAYPFLQDVITPHHQDYYSGKTFETQAGGSDRLPPADWDEPIPVPLVTVRPGAMFLVVIEGPKKWRQLAADILRSALEEEGVGAKTNAGYGRLTMQTASESQADQDKEKKREQERAIADQRRIREEFEREAMSVEVDGRPLSQIISTKAEDADVHGMSEFWDKLYELICETKDPYRKGQLSHRVLQYEAKVKKKYELKKKIQQSFLEWKRNNPKSERNLRSWADPETACGLE